VIYWGWASAQAAQHPVIDKIADKVIQKYQSSSCEQLAEKKLESTNKQRSPQEQQAMNMLRNNPELRTEFINRVAAPIANKMFECGMIP
jgi:hypothetical protein